MMTEESFVKLITNEISVAMQEHNKAMASGDSVASCINMGMVGGLTSALEVRGHHVEHKLLENGMYGGVRTDDSDDYDVDFEYSWKYWKESVI